VTPFWVALQKGFFKEEGLDAELIQVNPRLGAIAVLNGDLDFTTTFGTTLRSIEIHLFECRPFEPESWTRSPSVRRKI
jgi:hypothetical protein